MVAMIRSLAGASRMGAARMSTPARSSVVLPRTLRTSAIQLAAPNGNPKATGSEAAVHGEKNDADPATLQKETAKASEQARGNHDSASPNDQPTHSEDSVHADKHDHDPLPDHKKASNK